MTKETKEVLEAELKVAVDRGRRVGKPGCDHVVGYLRLDR